jgi:hypothetical protein
MANETLKKTEDYRKQKRKSLSALLNGGDSAEQKKAQPLLTKLLHKAVDLF